MKNGDIIKILEEFAPPSLAEEWDRIGLMTGTLQAENTGVLVTLDVTPETIKEAWEKGANLIVSHHPLIWDPIARIDEETSRGAMYAELIKKDMTVYSMHTNLDKTEGGINDCLAAILGGKDVQNDGLGRVFSLEGVTLKQLARCVSERLSDKTVYAVGDPDKIIKRAYVVGGSGGSEYARAKEVADVLITGEIKHNLLVEAKAEGFCLVGFSHFASEILAQDILSDALASYPINIIKAAKICPFWRLDEV